MTVQKFITYTPLNINGTQLDSSNELKLNVLEASGNYLLHKDILRHFNSQRQGTVSTKTRSEVRGGGRKPWRQKVLVVPEPVLIVHLYGRWWCNFGPKPSIFKVK
jgi:large subunit ribosomal protein L4